jgi:hypothetical protein
MMVLQMKEILKGVLVFLLTDKYPDTKIINQYNKYF